MVWFVMLITSWVTVVSDFICSIVLASIKKRMLNFYNSWPEKFSYIKTINNFKKMLYKAHAVHDIFLLNLFTFKLNNTRTEYNILKYLFQRSYLLSCNRICDDMMYIYMTDCTIFRRYVGDIHQSNCVQYTQQDNLSYTI